MGRLKPRGGKGSNQYGPKGRSVQQDGSAVATMAPGGFGPEPLSATSMLDVQGSSGFHYEQTKSGLDGRPRHQTNVETMTVRAPGEGYDPDSGFGMDDFNVTVARQHVLHDGNEYLVAAYSHDVQQVKIGPEDAAAVDNLNFQVDMYMRSEADGSWSRIEESDLLTEEQLHTGQGDPAKPGHPANDFDPHAGIWDLSEQRHGQVPLDSAEKGETPEVDPTSPKLPSTGDLYTHITQVGQTTAAQRARDSVYVAYENGN